MEIYEKVREYLYENIGHLTTPGTPRYDLKNEKWKVPVLCKTDRGILVVGEFILGKEGDFLKIPTKNEMQKIIESEISDIPYLFYGNKEQLEKNHISAVRI